MHEMLFFLGGGGDFLDFTKKEKVKFMLRYCDDFVTP